MTLFYYLYIISLFQTSENKLAKQLTANSEVKRGDGTHFKRFKYTKRVTKYIKVTF